MTEAFFQGVALGVVLGLILAYVVIPLIVDGWTALYRARYPSHHISTGRRGR